MESPRAKRRRDGKLVSQIQAHHYAGYSERQRLNVVWLCRPCHELAQLEANPRKSYETKQTIKQLQEAQAKRKKRYG
jgi:hypothetical protein